MPIVSRSHLTQHPRRTILICAALIAATVAAFWPVIGGDFVNYDDGQYVTKNLHVISGLHWKDVVWAFQTGYAGNWHPVTWLSHMLDCQLYGLRAGGHHLTSLLLHAANAVLLFLFLQSVTSDSWRVPREEGRGARGEGRKPGLLNESRFTFHVSPNTWACFFVAALFALHPLHVESVAWVSERKDVLSTFFFLLTLWAYARYVKSDGPQSTVHSPRSRLDAPGFYALALLFFALGLMSKPMLVTVPFVLLLLDYWPLGRLTHHASRITPHAPVWLILEKVPFFALAAASCVVTFVVQRGAGAVVALNDMTLGFRISNALIAYVRYVLKMVWPVNLAVFYPPPAEWPVEWIVGAGLILAGMSLATLLLARKAPWFAFGWFWYVGTLVPVIGIVQVGNQAMADRYSYIPLIGLFVVVAWGGVAAAERWRWSRSLLGVGAILVLLICGVLTWRQTSYWRGSASLFKHALTVTSGNFVAHAGLGSVLMAEGKPAAAESEFAETVRLKPYDADARYSLAVALAAQGKMATAIAQFRAALELRPDFPEVLNNLAWILAANPDAQVRNGAEAVELAERACKLTGYKQALLVGTLAAAYAEAGRFKEAVATAERAENLAEAANEPEVAARNRALEELYRSGKPARETQ